MVKDEDDEIDLPAENDDVVSDLPKPVLLNKKGLPKRILTPDQLQKLALAREKANAVRKANSITNGKGAVRDAQRTQAKQNREIVQNEFNNRVKIEVEKRLEEIKMDKINESISENMKKMMKKKKKVVVEQSDTDDTDNEVIQIVRKKQPPTREVEQQQPEQPPRPPKPLPPTPQELANQQKQRLIQHLLNRPPF